MQTCYSLQKGSSPNIKYELGESFGQNTKVTFYAIKNHPNFVAKIYIKNPMRMFSKMSRMVNSEPTLPHTRNHLSLLWPKELLYSEENQFVGVLLPKTPEALPLSTLYNIKSRVKQYHQFNWYYLHVTARNLAESIEAIHSKGHIVGNMNESSIFVKHLENASMITITETDSFQIIDGDKIYNGIGAKEEYLAPEFHSLDIESATLTQEQDNFALSVLIFLILMGGRHPFLVRNSKDTILERISKGSFSHKKFSTLKAPKSSYEFNYLHDKIQNNFIDAFVIGLNNPRQRPTATMWKETLDIAIKDLVVCKTNKNHVFNKSHRNCTWCEREVKHPEEILDFPSNEQINRIKNPHKYKIPESTYTKDKQNTVKHNDEPGIIINTIDNIIGAIDTFKIFIGKAVRVAITTLKIALGFFALYIVVVIYNDCSDGAFDSVTPKKAYVTPKENPAPTKQTEQTDKKTQTTSNKAQATNKKAQPIKKAMSAEEKAKSAKLKKDRQRVLDEINSSRKDITKESKRLCIFDLTPKTQDDFYKYSIYDSNGKLVITKKKKDYVLTLKPGDYGYAFLDYNGKVFEKVKSGFTVTSF